MKKEIFGHSGNNRLILIFAGWGMDSTPFSRLHKDGYDIAILWDYTGYTPQSADNKEIARLTEKYDETVVLAWSFGVRIATDFLKTYGGSLNITRRVGINGTPAHVHDRFGIPSRTFRLTLEGLAGNTLRKFHRRMFGSAESYARFLKSAPERSLESVTAELQTFGELPPADAAGVWDMAVVSGDDRIFPHDNQIAGWEGTPVTELADGAHFPDMQYLIDRFVVDKRLVAEKFAGAESTYADNATVQTEVAGKLWELAKSHGAATAGHAGCNILEIGYGSGTLTRLYSGEIPYTELTLWDIAPKERAVWIPDEAETRCCDAETAITELESGSVDLLLSASTLQWFHSPERFIKEVSRVLSTGGMAALALYGDGTFGEVEQATGRSLCYPCCQRLAATAGQCGLSPLHAETEEKRLIFPSVHEMAAHLKLTGVNALGGDKGASSSALRLMRGYPLLPDGTAPLTYRPIYLILKKQATQELKQNP